jgi:hypothetical protein
VSHGENERSALPNVKNRKFPNLKPPKSSTPSPTSETPAIIWLGCLVLWAVLFNLIGFFTFGFGPLTFFCLISAVLFLLYGNRIAAWLLPRLPRAIIQNPGKRLIWFLALMLFAVLIHTSLKLADSFKLTDWLVDIGTNTFAALKAFTSGFNPYAVKCQLGYEIASGPHAVVTAGSVQMYGLAYHYGYPYFPGMFFSYLPGFLLTGNYNGLRAENIFFWAANVAGVVWLTRRLTHKKNFPALFAVAALLCVICYPQEIFGFGIVDILLATYILYACLALSYEKYVLAGLLLGLAQASKLLPAPFFALPALLYLFRKQKGFRQFLLAYVLTAGCIILPFLLADPAGFISATILFYEVNHAGGDNTSLWFFLPAAVQPAFLVLGYIATLLPLWWLLRKRETRLTDILLAGFAGYIVFMAFSKMTHLNYLWGIYPLGCVALATLISDFTQKSNNGFKP